MLGGDCPETGPAPTEIPAEPSALGPLMLGLGLTLSVETEPAGGVRVPPAGDGGSTRRIDATLACDKPGTPRDLFRRLCLADPLRRARC